MSAFVRLAIVLVIAALPVPSFAADPLPKFTEEREAAALHFVRKHCPELLPLLEELKKSNRPAYESQIRETFQVTELLADLQDDQKRYDLELKVWKAENKALVLVAKLAGPKEDRKAIEDQLQSLARELVELDVQSLEHRVELLRIELANARDELTKSRDNFDRTVKDRFEALLEKAPEEEAITASKAERAGYNVGMKHVTDLFATVAKRVQAPVVVALGPPWPVANLVKALSGLETTCVQFDLHQSARVRECLTEVGATAEVLTLPDLWDLPPRFQTVIFPSSSQADRELKLDVVEQAYHVLVPGGLFLTLSEYEKDNQFAKWHKKVFGKCGETPSSENGMAFFSTRPAEEIKRRRHEVSFHAKLPDGPSMTFVTRPGTFSYGHFDNGSRAMLDVVEVHPGDHVLDLGCGNGAVGCLTSGRAGPTGKTTFIDSSLRALGLAELNARTNNVPNPRFLAATRLEGLEMNSFDVVLANPPYYAKSEITRLFVEGTRDLLRTGGRYYVVTKMPTAVVPMIFETYGDCTVIENRGYSVVMATV